MTREKAIAIFDGIKNRLVGNAFHGKGFEYRENVLVKDLEDGFRITYFPQAQLLLLEDPEGYEVARYCKG